MSLHVVASSSSGEQAQDRHEDGDPNGGVAANAEYRDTSVEQKVPAGQPRTKPPISIMPRIDNIPLHSPTPMVGTPFDVKVAYEYPFPSNLDQYPSSSVPNIPSPIGILTSRPPSAGSQQLLSGSPPPHTATSVSPPPVSASYAFSPAHPKMRSREPPVPPGLLTRRRISSKARSANADSIRSTGDENDGASQTGYGSAMSSLADSLPGQSTQNLISALRETKKEREVIGDGSVDLNRNVKINQAEAVEAAAADHRED